MAGASYDGGIQLVSAAIDRRLDTIAPTIAWHSLTTSLFPERTSSSAGAPAYDLQRSAGVVTFDDIRATMPLGEPVTASQPAASHTKKKKRHKRKHRR